jgi:hypothetical protein
MKNEAGLRLRKAFYFKHASAQFMWTKLCASVLSNVHLLDFKRESYTAQFSSRQLRPGSWAGFAHKLWKTM